MSSFLLKFQVSWTLKLSKKNEFIDWIVNKIHIKFDKNVKNKDNM